MSKGRALIGLAAWLAAVGCSNSNSTAPDGGSSAAGRRGGSVPATGRGKGGAGGGAGAAPSAGQAGAGGGAAGTGPTGGGATGTSVGAGGAGGNSAGAGGATGAGGTTGAAGAAGTSAPTGTAGAAGTSVGGATGAAGAAGAGAGGTGGGAACAANLVTHCTGTMNGAWCTETIPSTGLNFFQGLWADRPDDVWLVGGEFPAGGATPTSGALAHFDGCTWTVMQRNDLQPFTGVWGAAPNDVWIVSSSGIAYHWNGSTFTDVPVPGALSLASVSGTSASDVWAAGVPAIFHWNGSAWAQSTGATGNTVRAVSPSDVWVASGSTDALHFDGTTWTAKTLTDFGLFSIWADATQAYAGGEGEALFHFAGGSWTTIQGRGGSSQGFVAIGGFGPDVFAVGNGKVVRLSGNTFATVTDLPAGQFFRTVWVSATQIWLANSDGFIARRAR